MAIRYLSHAEVDKVAWDRCVAEAVNGLPYAYSWHLDVVAPGWDALVEGDYDSVFPLPWDRRLLGFRQSYNPMISQQLGPMSRHPLDRHRVDALFGAIPAAYRRLRIHLNAACSLPALKGWHITPRPNLILDLNRPYAELFSAYGKSLRRELRKDRPQHEWAAGGLAPEELVALFRQNTGHKTGTTAEEYAILEQHMRADLARGFGRLYRTCDRSGELGAPGFFLHSHGRIIYLFGTTTSLGWKLHSMHVLLDGLIERYAGQNLLLDFEGSAIPSIAYFFRSFGSVQETYHLLEKNTLPAWLKGAMRLRKAMLRSGK